MIGESSTNYQNILPVSVSSVIDFPIEVPAADITVFPLLFMTQFVPLLMLFATWIVNSASFTLRQNIFDSAPRREQMSRD